MYLPSTFYTLTSQLLGAGLPWTGVVGVSYHPWGIVGYSTSQAKVWSISPLRLTVTLPLPLAFMVTSAKVCHVAACARTPPPPSLVARFFAMPFFVNPCARAIVAAIACPLSLCPYGWAVPMGGTGGRLTPRPAVDPTCGRTGSNRPNRRHGRTSDRPATGYRRADSRSRLPCGGRHTTRIRRRSSVRSGRIQTVRRHRVTV